LLPPNRDQVSQLIGGPKIREQVTASTPRGGFFKNTIDLQWKIDANYNATPCADERKAAGAGTMGINGKTMRKTMETMKNTGE
jgi:hypothetical protein